MKAYNLETALQAPQKVTELYIYNRGLEDIPDAVFSMSNLKVLSLRKNRLKEVSDEISNLENLETIDFSENEFSEIPNSLFELPSLRSLSFNKNKLTSISKEIAQARNMEQFYAAHNQINKLPKTFFNSVLTKVDLSRNQLTKIPESIGKSKKLVLLDLKENKLTYLPDGLIECSKLQVLDLRANRIKILPKEFGRLTALSHVLLNDNKLEKLPEDIGRCFSLRRLSLERNRVESIPNSILQLKWLVHLALSKNKISSLPEAIGNLNSLQFLFLAGNPIHELPKGIFQLYNLSYLTLSDNTPPIQITPTSFLKLKRLQNLSGVRSLFSSEEKKRLLSFLAYARKKKMTEENYKHFYSLLARNKLLPKEQLIKALHFPMQQVRINARDQLFEFHNARLPISSKSILYFCGRSIPERKKYKELFVKLGIKCVEKEIAKKATHIILGAYPNQALLKNLENPTFLFERDIVRFFKEKKAEAYISYSDIELENLSELLRSAQSDSIGLALEMIKTAVIPDKLLTDLFIVYKVDSKGPHRELMKKLLIQNGSLMLEKKLQLRLSLSKKRRGEEGMKKIIEKYIEGTELLRARFYELLELEVKE